MSKKLILENGVYKTVIADPNKCRYLYENMCSMSAFGSSIAFPTDEYCKKCLYFTKE